MEHHTITTEPRRAIRGDEAALFAEHHDRLLRSVSHIVNTNGPTVEDACSFAWLQLMRTGPERGETLFAWLRQVAVREAIRLDRRFRQVVLMGEDTLDYVVEAAVDLDLEVEAREALRLVGKLPERQRQVLALFAAGHSYEEIGAATGDSRRTTERQLMRAKRDLERRRQRDLV